MSEAPFSATPDEIVDQITIIRERLSSNIDELVDRANPKNIAEREVAKVKGHFVDPNGHPRFENIMPVATAVAGSLAVIVLIRRLLG